LLKLLRYPSEKNFAIGSPILTAPAVLSPAQYLESHVCEHYSPLNTVNTVHCVHTYFTFIKVGFTLSQATKALRESRGLGLLYF